MPFSLHISNDLTAMMERLTADMKAHGQTLGPMQPQFIVTQTEGMNLWIRQNLAVGNRVAANVKFLQPMDLVSRLQFYADLNHQPKEPLTRDQWCWTIYGVLAEPDFANRFPMVRAYCADDDLRRVALAWRLADLFDQYQIYRSDDIRLWNKWTVQELAETQQWQAVLWRRVKELCGDGVRDRVQAADELIGSFGELEVADRIRERFSHLYIFGLAVITPFFKQIFEQLSLLVHIHLYQVNPSPREYWLDDTSEKRLARLLGRKAADAASRPLGNDLLINWGDVVKDSFQLLFKNEDLINTADDSGCRPPDANTGESGTLLNKIQSAIYHNKPASSLKDSEDISFSQDDIRDGSVVIRGCFTPAREVEVLYNYLVELLNASGGAFAARDILVTCTDIARYAPYIRATFDHGPVKIPYAIADVPLGSGDNMFTALAAVLDFDGDVFRAEDVMILLEHGYVRRRMGIEDVDRLRRAVLESGTRFGLRGKLSQDEEAYPSSWFSWQHGLKRMIYGLTMLLPEDQLFSDGEDEVLPLASAEGPTGIDRIRLAYFLRVLEAKVSERSIDRTLAHWADYLKSAMEDLVFSAAEKEDEDYQRFIRILEDLAVWEHPAGLKIPFRVFRHQFKDRLKAEQRSGQFASRGITFCSPVPMRSIPHRMVAMLGMDFDAFPRDEQSVNFSLMAKFQPGDRNIRKNDNHLFLETLLSAREKFYISYQARNLKDGTELPPSALVDELLDFVARTCGTDADALRKEWVEIHPLHPFSNRYNGKELKNYLKPDRFATGISLKDSPPVAYEMASEINSADIARFLVNPAQHFLNKRLNVYYREDDAVIPDHELFEFDTLSEGAVKKVLLRIDDANALEEWRQRQARNCQVPAGNIGIAAIMELEERISDTRSVYEECIEGLTPADEGPIYLLVNPDTREVGRKDAVEDKAEDKDKITVSATISGLFRNNTGGFFLVRPATSSKLKNAIEAFVEFIILVSSGQAVSLNFITSKGNLLSIPADAFEQKRASGILADWILNYRQALQGFIPAHPNLAALFLADELPEAGAVNCAVEYVERNLKDYPFNDPSFLQAWREKFLERMDEPSVIKIHHELYGDIFKHLPKAFKGND